MNKVIAWNSISRNLFIINRKLTKQGANKSTVLWCPHIFTRISALLQAAILQATHPEVSNISNIEEAPTKLLVSSFFCILGMQRVWYLKQLALIERYFFLDSTTGGNVFLGYKIAINHKIN